MSAKARIGSYSDRDIVSGSPLFDTNWYLEAYPDVRAAGADAVVHFCDHGWREGRDPGPKFSSKGYLEAHDDVAQADFNPLVHYEIYGRKEGRTLLPNQEAPLRGEASAALDGHLQPSSHLDYIYVRQLVELSGLWDESWYLRQYYQSYISAREHDGFDGTPLDFFLRVGWKMGHRPCDAFRPIVPATNGMNPIVELLTRRRFIGYLFVDNSWFPAQEKIDHHNAQRDARQAAPHGERKVCYTCIAGGYDRLIQPHHIEAGWDYVCFTDDAELLDRGQLGVWEIRPLILAG